MVRAWKTLKIENITCVADSREQRILRLDPLKTIVKKLDVADYSVEHLEHKIAVEKKSLDDLCACVGRERQRFDTMVEKLLDYEYRAIVVTANWHDIDLKFYSGTRTPTQIYSSLMGWALTANVPIIFAGDEIRAGKLVARLLWVSANRIFRAAKEKKADQEK